MKVLRYATIVAALLCMLLLLYHSRKIESHFARQYGQFKEYSTHKYPTAWSEWPAFFNIGYKWPYFIFYAGCQILLTIALVYLLFLNPTYVKLTVAIYGLLGVIILLLSLISVLTGSYKLGFGAIQPIKYAITTPYPLMFFVLYFYYVSRANNPKNSA